MSEQVVLQGNAYDNFVNAIKTKESEKTYNFALRKFMLFQNVQQVNDLMVPDPKSIEAKIIAWIVHLKKVQQVAPVTINTYLAPIMLLYAMNDITLNKRKINKYLPESQRQYADRAYSREEIAQLLNFCNERERALILLLASTGMRIGAVPDLQIQHLRKISDYGIYQITVYAGWINDEHYCFTTPEATKAIEAYLEYRQRYGEKINPDSPLIREQFDVNDLGDVRSPKKMDRRILADLIRNKLHRSGIFEISKMIEGQTFGKKRNSIARCHGFRKFVNTTMIHAKVNDTARNMMLGHSTGLDKAYYKPKSSDLLDEYIKAVDMLTINEENRLRKRVQELTIKTDKLEILQQQIDALNKKLGLQ